MDQLLLMGGLSGELSYVAKALEVFGVYKRQHGGREVNVSPDWVADCFALVGQ